jgi:hypothetical protein
MARTGTNKTGTGVGPNVFDWRYPLAAAAVFGSYLVLADLGEPGLAMVLAAGTAFLFLLRTDYGAMFANSVNDFAKKIGG